MISVAIGLGILAVATIAGCQNKSDPKPAALPPFKPPKSEEEKNAYVCEAAPPSPPTPKPNISVPKTSKSCPSGWQEHPVILGEGNFKLCHLDQGKRDQVFQENSDKLGLQWGDEFIGSEDPRFKNLSDELFLPSFSGKNLKLWKQDHDFLFPKGATFRGEEDFRDVQEYSARFDLDFEEIKKIAANLRPPRQNPGKDWNELNSQEKVYGLTIASLFKGLAKEKGDFYLPHQGYVDGILNLIAGGKLYFQEVPSLARPGPTGYLSTSALAYFPQSNLLQVTDETELGLKTVRQKALLIHELFHFYQDSKAIPISFEEMEASAYQTQAEFIISTLREGGKRSPREAVELFLKDNPDIFDYLKAALLWVQNRLEGNASQAEQNLKTLRDAIHSDYFLLPIVYKLVEIAEARFGHNRVEGGKKYFGDKKPNQEETLEFFKAILKLTKEDRDKDLQKLKDNFPNSAPTENFANLEGTFAAAVGTSLLYILHKRDWETKGQGFRTFCPNLSRDKEIIEALKLITPLRPLQKYIMKMDGVE